MTSSPPTPSGAADRVVVGLRLVTKHRLFGTANKSAEGAVADRVHLSQGDHGKAARALPCRKPHARRVADALDTIFAQSGAEASRYQLYGLYVGRNRTPCPRVAPMTRKAAGRSTIKRPGAGPAWSRIKSRRPKATTHRRLRRSSSSKTRC